LAEALYSTGILLNGLSGEEKKSAELREKKIKLIIKPNPNITTLPPLHPSSYLLHCLPASSPPRQIIFIQEA
jgi:hypothetical protein